MAAVVAASVSEVLCGARVAPESNAKPTSSQVITAASAAAATINPIRCPRLIWTVVGTVVETFTAHSFRSTVTVRAVP